MSRLETIFQVIKNDEIDTLFQEPEGTTEEETEVDGNQEGKTTENQERNDGTETTEVKGNLFEGDDTQEPESVGSEDYTEGEKEGSSTEDGGGTSPKDNFYSSIATE